MIRQDLRKKIKKFPDTPGVYFFRDVHGKILYIGKATSLRARVRSYFNKDVPASRGPAIIQMLKEARKVDCKETDSVLEALLLEAKLIKKHQPKYNTKEKSNKSFNCIVITNEEYPRVLIKRQRELETDLSTAKVKPLLWISAPFPQGSALKEALMVVRKIFPFRDICKPSSEKPCFNRQLGLCPGVCTGEISKTEYKKTIRNIRQLLEGKKKTLLTSLTRVMKKYAVTYQFEKAAGIRNQIFAIQHIQDVSLIKNISLASEGRIEAYDIAHTSGTHTVGAMTVVADGEKQLKEYRIFNIKTVAGPNDTKALAELLERRFRHHEWEYPKFIVVDGGNAQKNRAEAVLHTMGISIPVVAVVKDERHKPRNILGNALLIKKYENNILLANGESHRFAITRHRKKRGKIT